MSISRVQVTFIRDDDDLPPPECLLAVRDEDELVAARERLKAGEDALFLRNYATTLSYNRGWEEAVFKQRLNEIAARLRAQGYGL